MSETGTATDRFESVASLGSDPRWVDPTIVTRVDNGWRLLGSRCRDCDSRFFPKAFTCATCLKNDLEPFALSADGELHVSADAAATQPGFFAPARYAWVNLPREGVRIFAHLVPVAGPQPAPGTAVEFFPVVVGADADGPLCSIAFRTKA